MKNRLSSVEFDKILNKTGKESITQKIKQLIFKTTYDALEINYSTHFHYGVALIIVHLQILYYMIHTLVILIIYLG